MQSCDAALVLLGELPFALFKLGVDVQDRDAIERRCPGMVAWFWTYTFRRWALVWAGTWRLVDAPTSQVLVTAIQHAPARRPASR